MARKFPKKSQSVVLKIFFPSRIFKPREGEGSITGDHVAQAVDWIVDSVVADHLHEYIYGEEESEGLREA